MFRALFIALTFFISWVTFASSDWLDLQWNKIPKTYQVEKPSVLFPISEIDRKMLASNIDPILRNQYINHTYYLLGQEFNRCLHTPYPFGNWYFYASWASKSAGEIISGRKFDSLNGWQEFWVNILQLSRVLKSQEELQNVFASVNQMIATEMIPLGKEFLDHFCSSTPKSWEEFEAKMLNTRPEEKLLRRAMHNYYLAIHEQNINLKKELITLASTQQVISEQMRVDRPIKYVFNTKGPAPIKHIIQKQCTGMGNYKMESAHSFTQIMLGEDIKRVDIDSDLKTIELPALKQLYKQQQTLKTKDKMYVKGTACRNWGDLNQRKKFLTAMFWVYINKADLINTPERKYKNFDHFNSWNRHFLK